MWIHKESTENSLYDCCRLSTKKDVDLEKLEQIKSNVMKRKAQLYEVEQTLPKPNGIYLKIILGNVNVSILNKQEK